jgi:tripartite-type tricarboxylate transporter receptor subunit TctC
VPAAGEHSENQFNTGRHMRSIRVALPGAIKGRAMKLPRREFLGLAAAALPAASRIARAETYPTRPITMIVPYAPGGATDTIGRVMAERMKSSLGQPVIVENVTGAGGTIAVGRAARAAADGYTLSLGQNGSHVVNGATYALQFDLLKDFEPVALISFSPSVLVARKTMPANDLKGLIAWLKANPGKASQGTGGNGSIQHVAGVLFRNETGTRFQFVPYRGIAPAIQDLVAGQIDIAISDPVASMPQVRAGTIKAYGVTTKTGCSPRPTSQRWTRRDCPGSTSRNGMGFGCPRARRKTSSLNSMAPSLSPWPTRRCGRGWPT